MKGTDEMTTRMFMRAVADKSKVAGVGEERAMFRMMFIGKKAK